MGPANCSTKMQVPRFGGGSDFENERVELSQGRQGVTTKSTIYHIQINFHIWISHIKKQTIKQGENMNIYIKYPLLPAK